MQVVIVDRAQEFERLIVFDALGDHKRPGLVGERRHRHQHRAGARFGGRGDHDARVELDELGVDLAQHLQPRVARADVVQRCLEPLLAQPPQALHDRRRAPAEALGDLDHDPLRRQPGPLDRQAHPVVLRGVEVERLGREVDEQQHGRIALSDHPQRVLHAQHVELVDAPELLGDVECLGRPGEPVGGVGTHQRLDPQQCLLREVPDRLEHGLEAPLVDQRADGFLLHRGGHGHALANVIEVRAAVTPLALGLIQRGVGLGAQRVGPARCRRFPSPGPYRADADTDLDAGVGEAAAQAARERAGAARVGVRQKQRELVAPDSVGAISRPRLAQDLGDVPEHRVAVRMPVAVVDELEVVDIQHDQGQRILIARRGGDGLGELVLEGALVGQVGQPVARRALQGSAMVAHQGPPPDQVEDGAAPKQREQPDQQEHHPQIVQLRVVGAVVVGDLVGIAAAGQLDGDDKLEVLAILRGVGLAAGV